MKPPSVSRLLKHFNAFCDSISFDYTVNVKELSIYLMFGLLKLKTI